MLNLSPAVTLSCTEGCKLDVTATKLVFPFSVEFVTVPVMVDTMPEPHTPDALTWVQYGVTLYVHPLKFNLPPLTPYQNIPNNLPLLLRNVARLPRLHKHRNSNNMPNSIRQLNTPQSNKLRALNLSSGRNTRPRSPTDGTNILPQRAGNRVDPTLGYTHRLVLRSRWRRHRRADYGAADGSADTDVY